MKVTIFDIENWKEIGSTLARNKTRTFLTGFGIFWGVAMLAILMGGARGAEDMLRRNFAGFATNSAIVFPNPTTIPYKGNQKGRFWNLDLTDVELMRQALPELEVISPMMTTSGASFKNGRFAYSGNTWGVESAFPKVMTPKMYSGRFINDADVANERKVAVIGKKVADQIFPTDPDPVGKQMQVNSITYTVVGVAGQTSVVSIGGQIDECVLLPSSTFRRAFNRGDKIDYMQMVAKDNAKIADLKNRIRHLIYYRHYISPADDSAMWLMDISEEFKRLDTLFKGISLLALFIGASTLLAGVIGIGNIMWVIVKERTQEIGIRRALGAKPRDIIAQVLSEGIVLTSIAGIAGITFAVIALGITQHLTTDDVSVPRFQMNLMQAATIMVTFIVLGTLAGLIPSIKAMKIKPIEALNDK